jgi:hypothetical protein
VNSSPPPSSGSRRRFLQSGLVGAGLIGVAAWSARWARRAGLPSRSEKNPYAYDLDRYEPTDASWLHYEETARIRPVRKQPRKIALGPDDQPYLAAGNYVCALQPDGACGLEIALDETVRCLAVGKDRTIYVGLRKHIEVFDPQGRRRASWDPPGPRAWLTGVTAGSDKIWVADAGTRLVYRYDPAGRLEERIGRKDRERNIPGFIIPSPFFDLEWHPDGLLRVANPGRHQVEMYTARGDLEYAWGRPSAALAGFCGCCNPINLALLPDGRCVTCEKGLPRVKVYSARGQLESVVAGPESFSEQTRLAAEESSDSSEAGLDAAVDSQGRIYILDSVTGDVRIMKRKAGTEPSNAGAPV